MAASDRLRAYGIERRYRAGTAVFHEGDRSGAAYLLVSGRVRIEVVTPSGGRLVLAVKEPGDLFGELGVLDGRVRSASALAMSAIAVIQIPVDIDLSLTQDDLAGWIGATREATARSLRALRKRECVTTARRRVTIIDAVGLCLAGLDRSTDR